ncbi:dTMP kinase [Sphingomicrobium aestuariivivum]|uniref:dTMP kinase n=1 Tax=Sphingomicrobium aestuariivivum TaxID=1582356 RepID=UPI001FD67A2F|nr:dTMP kinase [Sphingomicrobium aestuariivivum]MCJ8189837.1 dTMP kinase [Sphingomicrobium aestuariivivum]
MVRGRFISLEGGEGVGKSTQLAALAQALEGRGLEVVVTREPGGSPGAEAIRKLLLEGEETRWTPRAEALLFAAARADHIAKTIRPALDEGKWVLSDRFLDSSLAYQGEAGGLGFEAIRDLHRFGSEDFLPDRTLVLRLEGGEGARRAATRDTDGADRIGGRPPSYHAMVDAGFAKSAETDPERVKLVDAGGSAATVTARLLYALGDLLP